MKPIVEYDDGSAVYLDSYSGGAHAAGAWSEVTLRMVDAAGVETRKYYRGVTEHEENVRRIVREELEAGRTATGRTLQEHAQFIGLLYGYGRPNWDVAMREDAARAQAIDPESDELNALYAVARAARKLAKRLPDGGHALTHYFARDDLLALRGALEKL